MSLLETKQLEAFYGDFQALFGIDLVINTGETVAVIGSNGAGKSTFLRSLTGLLCSNNDSIVFDGKPIGKVPAYEIIRLGIALVPEGYRLFSSLSVEENLLIGGYCKREGDWNLERTYELFPILEEKKGHPGTSLSGGQQQMVSIGRALMSNPKLLLCDEISLGLAPTVIKNIYSALPAIKKNGVSVLIIEQDIQKALEVSDRFYCFQEGKISLSGKPNEYSHKDIKAAYFGM